MAWSLVAGRPWWQIFWDPARATPARAAVGLAVGAVLGMLVVGLSRWSVARFGWGRELYRWFATLLGPVRWRDALWLASLSSIAEETFFRGAMQPSLGLLWTSAIFGLLHLPPRLRLAPWTVSAVVLGVAFGLLASSTGTVFGAMLAHFLINLFNLRHVSSFCDPPP